MHMRRQVQQGDIFLERVSGFHFVVRVAGWNRELELNRGPGERAILRCVLANLQSQQSAIGGGFSVGRVVHLEKQRGAGLHQKRGVRIPGDGWNSRSVTDQHVAELLTGASGALFTLLHKYQDVMHL